MSMQIHTNSKIHKDVYYFLYLFRARPDASIILSSKHPACPSQALTQGWDEYIFERPKIYFISPASFRYDKNPLKLHAKVGNTMSLLQN